MVVASLLDPAERERLIARLATLEPDSRPRWGRMDAGAMLAHLHDGFALSFGEHQSEAVPGFLRTTLGRWIVLRLPFPRGVTAPAVFHRTEPGAFEADRARVRAGIERFATDPGAATAESPIFGPLTPSQWARLHAKHLRHHLKQFGC